MSYRDDQFRDPGRLNTRVDLQRLAEPLDDFHGTPEYVTDRTCWAEYIPLRGERLATFQQQYGVVTHECVLRSGGMPITTQHMVRRYRDGKRAAVVSALPVDGGQRWVQLILREVE